jgi:hypothetical protein
MIRVRFKADYPDYRPLVYPPPHPYWHMGSAVNLDYSILVAYAENEKQLMDLWPDAAIIFMENVKEYVFDDRHPRPEWME